MHINSCLIHFSLACFPCTIIFISYDMSFQFETMQQHIVSHSHNLYLSYEFYHKSNKPLIDIWVFMSIMNTCSHFPFLVLLVIYIRNKPSHIRAFISTMNTLLYFLLQLLLATLSPTKTNKLQHNIRALILHMNTLLFHFSFSF